MSELADWRIEAHSLILAGELTYKTLLPLWEQKDELIKSAASIDVSDLSHVDSSGLALILQFANEANKKGNRLKIVGVTDKLNTLITLYNLNDMMSDSLSV